MLALLAACDWTPTTSPREAATPTRLDSNETGTITGTVRFTGDVPPSRRVDVSTDPTCAERHPSGLVLAPVEAPDGLVRDVFVYVAEGLEDRVFETPQQPVLIDQRGCLYAPFVAGAQTGQPIRFTSSDDTLHNVHGAPTRSRAWNFGLSRVGAERTVVLNEPEVMVPLECDVHPWMRGYIGVLPHPYFAVTGADGRYTLTNVPAGRYVVATWHPHLGPAREEVTVTARTPVTADFTLALPAPSPFSG